MDKKEFFSRGGFFTRDLAKTAEYAWAWGSEECRRIIKAADDAVRQRFAFNLRWDLEQTKAPVVFEGRIDWLRQPGDDPEFVYAFNRQRFWISLGQAYALTGDEKYAKAFCSQLVDWVRSVRFSDKASAKAWRTIEAGFRMEYWSKAIFYFKDSPSLTEEVIDAFILSMSEHAEYLMGVWDSYHLLSNWGVIENHGLFIVSAVLPETERTLAWRKEAVRRLDAEARTQIYDDGIHWEQSAMYWNEVLSCFLDVLIIASRRGIELPDTFVSRVHSLARAAALTQKPDGSETMSGDSDDIDQRDVTEKSAYVFSDPLIRYFGEDHMTFDALWDVGAEAALEYERLDAESPSGLLSVFPDSGRAIYRNEGTFLMFKDGTLGAGHGHADQTHFDLFYGGEDILVDPGRFTYVDKPERYEFKGSEAHNVLTLDGKASYEAKDSWEYSRMSQAYGFKCKEKDGFAFIKGGHLGYPGAFVSRKLVALRPDLFVVSDEVYSSEEHSVESHLHFSEQGSVTVNGNAIKYKSPLNQAYVTVSSDDVTLERTRISRHYNEAVLNDSVTVRSRDNTLFTAISLGREVKVEKLPVYSNFKGIRFSDKLIEAYSVDGFVVVITHYEWGSPTDSFLAGGCTGWGQLVVFRPGEKETGTVLEY